jgi:hypothetical protein
VDPRLAAPPAPAARPADRPYTPWLVFAGIGLLILSEAFPWSLQPFIPPDQQRGLYGTGLSVPALLSRGSLDLSAPTAAQVIAILVLSATVFLIVPSRWADVLRRVIGAVALLLFGLFAWRLSQFLSEGVPEGIPGFPAVLRAGFYLGVVGAILLIAAPGRKVEASKVRS